MDKQCITICLDGFRQNSVVHSWDNQDTPKAFVCDRFVKFGTPGSKNEGYEHTRALSNIYQ